MSATDVTNRRQHLVNLACEHFITTQFCNRSYVSLVGLRGDDIVGLQPKPDGLLLKRASCLSQSLMDLIWSQSLANCKVHQCLSPKKRGIPLASREDSVGGCANHVAIGAAMEQQSVAYFQLRD